MTMHEGVLNWTILGLVLAIGLGLFASLYFRLFIVQPQGRGALDREIRRRGGILTAVLVVLAIIVAGAGYLHLRQESREFRAEFFEKQTSIATIKAEQLQAWLSDSALDARQIRESLSLTNLSDLTSVVGKKDEILGYFEAARQTSAERMGINILAPDGSLIVGVGETIGRTGGLPEILSAALTSEKPKIIETPDLDARPSSFRVHILVPLGSSDGRRPAVAVLILTIDPRQGIFNKIREWPTKSRSSEVLVVRPVGDEVVFLNALRHRDSVSSWLRLSLKEDSIPAVQAAFHAEGVYEGVDYRGASVLSAYRRIEGVPWSVIAKTDVDEGTSSIRQRNALVSLIIGLALATAALFTAYLWRDQQSLHLAYQRRQLEERAAITRHYERLIQTARDIFLLIDSAGNVVEFNESALATYGYSAEEMRSKNVRELRTQEANDSFLQDWQSADQAGGVLFETTHRRKDGTTFPVEISSRVIDIDGKSYRQSSIRIITERKRLEDSLLRLTRVLSALQVAKGVLLKARTEDELFQDMCDSIVSAGGYRMANVGIAEQDEEKSVRFVAIGGDDGGYLAEAGITWSDGVGGSGPTGTAIKSGEIQVNQSFQTNERMTPWRAAALKQGFQASISLPLRDAGRVFGALTIYASQPDAFNSEEVELLRAFADDTSYGVSALRTRIKVATATAQLRDSMERTIGVLAEAMEVRDPYTAGHQFRVAQLARAIAQELGLPAEMAQGIYFGGLIHDFGKISIPAEILSKPGKLTKIEYDLIKQHSKVGSEIVRSVAFPWPVADMIRQHHERLDGSGYPDGLKGEAISAEGRILAVADVMEAMMSHRPYRPALGIESALKELGRGRGTSYDPAAVDACVALFRSRRFEFTDKKET